MEDGPGRKIIDFESERKKREKTSNESDVNKERRLRTEMMIRIQHLVRSLGFLVTRTHELNPTSSHAVFFSAIANGKDKFKVTIDQNWEGDTLRLDTLIVEEIKPVPFRSFGFDSEADIPYPTITYENMQHPLTRASTEMAWEDRFKFLDDIARSQFDPEETKKLFDQELEDGQIAMTESPGLSFEIGWINPSM